MPFRHECVLLERLLHTTIYRVLKCCPIVRVTVCQTDIARYKCIFPNFTADSFDTVFLFSGTVFCKTATVIVQIMAVVFKAMAPTQGSQWRPRDYRSITPAP
jgi:hypothetical protein